VTDFQKPSNLEDEYFAREELEAKQRLARQQRDQLAQAEKERLQKLHFMKCPKCGMDLHTVKFGRLDVDTCFSCHGVFLDAGELQQIAKQDARHPVVDAILNWFKHE
jgi:hypothetical protein